MGGGRWWPRRYSVLFRVGSACGTLSVPPGSPLGSPPIAPRSKSGSKLDPSCSESQNHRNFSLARPSSSIRDLRRTRSISKQIVGGFRGPDTLLTEPPVRTKRIKPRRPTLAALGSPATMSYQTQYHEDSDADDEYERSVAASPQLPTDSEASPTDTDSLSTEHTPTTYGHDRDEYVMPRTVITEWTAEECADFVASLGLRQYRSLFTGNVAIGLVVRGPYLTSV